MVMIRFAIILLVVLTVIYVALSLYSRSVRRGKLEEWYDEEPRDVDRDAFIEQGLKDYDGSLRRKLIWGVYVVPLTLIAVLVYVTNFM